MSIFKSSTLRRAFGAVALATAFTGIVPSPLTPQAQAAVPVVAVSSGASAAAAAAAAAAASAAAAERAREDRAAENAVIVNPSDQNISALAGRGLVDGTTIPYIRESVAEMKIPAGTNPDAVSDQQRDWFSAALQNKKLIGEMSAATADQAVARGLSSSLAPYFMQCKTDLGFPANVTLPQAQALMERMSDLHWQKDTKPALEKTGLIAGGAFLLLGGGLALARSRRRSAYGSSYDY